MMSRRALVRRVGLAALSLLVPGPVLASGKGGANIEVYAKLPTIVIEFWDAQGVFHVVNMDLTVVFPAQASINKKVTDKISQNLSAMTWEEFSHGNPAATIKAVALEVLRKDPSTETATEVLVGKLLLR